MGAPRAAAVGGNGAAGGRGAGPKTSSGSALGRESGEGEGVRAIWLTRESLGGSGRGRSVRIDGPRGGVNWAFFNF